MFNKYEIEKLNCTKGRLAELLGLKTFDYALPQQWLNDFSKYSRFNYNFILATTFWNYDFIMGYPISACTEINEEIKKYMEED